MLITPYILLTEEEEKNRNIFHLQTIRFHGNFLVMKNEFQNSLRQTKKKTYNYGNEN